MEANLSPATREAIQERMRLLIERFSLDGEAAAKLARVAGGSAVSQWKTGTIPSWSSASNLCDNLGITMDWIYRGARGGLSPAVYERLYGELPPGGSGKRRGRPSLKQAR